MRTASSQRESQGRATLAVLALIGVVAVLGVLVWYLGPFRAETPVDQGSQGQDALVEAMDKANQVFGAADLVNTDPEQAATLLQDAWDSLERAKGQVDQQAWDTVHADVAMGLDELYQTAPVSATAVYAAPTGEEISGLVLGPDDAAYAIVGSGVVRVDPDTGAVTTAIQSGEGTGQGIGKPRLLARGGPDLLVTDEHGSLWRWRPSGTLGQVRVAGDQVWGDDVVDIETFVINADQGLYRLYVPYPSSSQVLRYEPTADGSGFSAPAPYFVANDEPVSTFRQLLIDGDVYAVTNPDLLQYFNGRRTGFSLDPAPDNANLRPGHEYELIAATGTRGVGRLYVWDKQWARILVYDKAEGTYDGQFVAADGAPPLTDLRGMYLIDRGQAQPPILIWARPEGIYRVELSKPVAPSASPAPSSAASAPPTAAPSLAPSAQPSTGPSASPSTPAPGATPTERPRRTPRPAAATPSP